MFPINKILDSQENTGNKHTHKASDEKERAREREREKEREREIERERERERKREQEREMEREVELRIERERERKVPAAPPAPGYRLSRRISGLRKFDRNRSSKKNSKPPISIILFYKYFIFIYFLTYRLIIRNIWRRERGRGENRFISCKDSSTSKHVWKI